jgi:hypothetical protein
MGVPWGEVPTFHGAASQTPVGAFPEGDSVPGRVESRLGSPPSWGSRGRTFERSGPSVPRRLQSAGRPQGQDPIQSLSATLSYMQSTWNPHVLHVRGHAQSTYVATWAPWRSTSKGVTKGMVERAGAPMPPERGDPRVCRAWPEFGTTFSRGSPGPRPGEGRGGGLGALGRVVGLAAGVQDGDIGGGGGAMGSDRLSLLG